jgi:hypothetical protein
VTEPHSIIHKNPLLVGPSMRHGGDHTLKQHASRY